jgi:hypothetical protein
MVVDLGKLYSRNRRGSPGAPAWSPRCAGRSLILADPGWCGGLVASPTQRCAMLAALERAVWPGVKEYLSKRPAYGEFSFFSGKVVCAFATFVPGKGLLSRSVPRLPRRPSHPPSRALREARTENRPLVSRPTRSSLAFRQVWQDAACTGVGGRSRSEAGRGRARFAKAR